MDGGAGGERLVPLGAADVVVVVVWVPRLRGKPYSVLRDAHTVPGLYVGPLLVLLAVTGLFFSVVWLWSLNTLTGGAGEFPRHFWAGPPSSASAAVAPRRP